MRSVPDPVQNALRDLIIPTAWPMQCIVRIGTPVTAQ